MRGYHFLNVFSQKSNEKDNTIMRGDSGTKSLVVYFSQADVVDLDKTDMVVQCPDADRSFL